MKVNMLCVSVNVLFSTFYYLMNRNRFLRCLCFYAHSSSCRTEIPFGSLFFERTGLNQVQVYSNITTFFESMDWYEDEKNLADIAHTTHCKRLYGKILASKTKNIVCVSIQQIKLEFC